MKAKITSVLLALLLISGCSKPLPTDKLSYVGEWKSKQMGLLIAGDGNMAYKRLIQGGTKSVNGPIKSFEGDDFVVGVLFLETRFVVSEPPHEVNGSWQMVVDGVRLTKVGTTRTTTENNISDKKTVKRKASPSLMTVGWKAYKAGRYEEAIEKYTEHIDFHSVDEKSLYYRGLAYEKAGNNKAALDDFVAATQFEPTHIDSYLHIDYLLAKESKYGEIISHWDNYMSFDSSNGRAYLERGGAYFRSGQKALALDDAQQACDLGENKGCQLIRKYSR